MGSETVIGIPAGIAIGLVASLVQSLGEQVDSVGSFVVLNTPPKASPFSARVMCKTKRPLKRTKGKSTVGRQLTSFGTQLWR